MVDKKIKIGFIGCGSVSDNHYKAISNCTSAELTGVSDMDEKLGLSRAESWGVRYYSCDDIINDPDIEAVFVLTPIESHYSYARKALENGKHVLVEKPLSNDIAEIINLEKISQQVGKVCFPGHSYIYLPELTRMVKMTKENKIGTPTAMFMSEIYFMHESRVRKYHGSLCEVLCHQIYIMLALMGIPNRVQAFSGCFRNDIIPSGDEQVMVNVEFGNGALANLFISWAVDDETSDPSTFKVKVLGTDGGLHFSRRDVVSGVQGRVLPWDYPLYDEMFNCEVEYFVNHCILERRQPLSTLHDAAITMRILKAIQTSIYNGKAEVITDKIGKKV